MEQRRRVPYYERRVQFFKALTATATPGEMIPLGLEGLVEPLNALNRTEDRYHFSGDRVTGVLVDDVNPPRFTVLDVRRDELPQLEQGGRLEDLRIPRDAGIAEQSHVVGFDRGVVGADFNFHGPRITRLAEFIQAKLGHPVVIRPLVRRDVARELEAYQDVKLVHLQIDRTLLPVVQEVDPDLGAAFAAGFASGQPGQVELVLRPEPYERRHGLGRQLLESVRALARRPEIHRARKFEVQGVGRSDLLDVLSEHISVTKRIARAGPRSRSLNAVAAHSAIMEAHRDLADELADAAVLGL